jgi:predicted ester cyclase
MSDNTKTVARAFYESYNEGDLDRSWESYIAPDLINHAMGGAYDGDGWREVDKSMLVAFPDTRVQVLDQVAEDDKVATRMTFTGTQVSEFFGIPAAGVTATLSVTAVDRVAGGKIVEHWSDADVAGFLQSLTPVPAS